MLHPSANSRRSSNPALINMNNIIFLPNDLIEGGDARPVCIELVTKNEEKTEIIILADMESQLRIPRSADWIFPAEFQHIQHSPVSRSRPQPSQLFLARSPYCRTHHPAYRGNVLRRNLDEIRPQDSLHPRRSHHFHHRPPAHAELPDASGIRPACDGGPHSPVHGPVLQHHDAAVQGPRD